MKQTFLKFFYVGILVAFFASPSNSNAASLYIDPAINNLFRGDSITLAVRLDTNESTGECVNAVDAVIKYSNNIEPVDISIGESIFNIWVERPTINKKERTITFAGGIPNGYCGRVAGDPRLTNVLTEIVFRSPGFSIGGVDDASKADVSFGDETTAYLNDGRGTKASLSTYGSSINLDKRAGNIASNEWQSEVEADTVPPEEFSINLQKGEGNFSDKYYVVFNTSDKQTGISQYKIMEEPLTQFGSFQWGRADAPWIEVQSPYVLKDQTLNSIIRVQAMDKAGNTYIANLIPDESMRTLSSVQIKYIIAIFTTFVLGATVFGILYVFFVVRRRKKTDHDEREEESEIDDIANTKHD
jgi:hypothetical protein